MGLKDWLKDMTRSKVAPMAVDDSSYAQLVEQSDLPVLLDVWGPNCSWCVKLAPTINALADKYQGVVRVAHLNAAACPKANSKLRVMGTPTVLLMRKGRIVERIAGFKPQAFYEQAMVVKFPEVFEAGDKAPA